MPLYPITPAPQQLLLLNTYDIVAQEFRENKENLFISLADSILLEISKDVRKRSGIESTVVFGLTRAGDSGFPGDSIMRALMNKHNTSHAVAITFIDVYFDKTNVEVTKDEDGTSREAFYDLVSHIDYGVYDEKGLFKGMKIEQSRFHSSRTVLSGFFAAGPNVVKNRDDAFSIARHNLLKFLNNFFPGSAERVRIVFVGKELAAVKTALGSGDYEKAMEESLRFINHTDRKLAAKANYNCAVLCERKNQHAEVKQYLRQSLSMQSLLHARSMMNDY